MLRRGRNPGSLVLCHFVRARNRRLIIGIWFDVGSANMLQFSTLTLLYLRKKDAF